MKKYGFSSFTADANGRVALGLERIRCLLALLGNPQEQVPFVHAAGTNGKGSFCAFLCAILKEAGIRTGRYLSPELLEENERISLNGEDISHKRLASLFACIEPHILQVQEITGAPPSPFELWTAAAFLYFAQENCSLVICEAGLGGKGDATNAIPAPILAVLTRISLDHRRFLGSTAASAAENKSYIIKKGCVSLTAPQSPSVRSVLEARCQLLEVSLTVLSVPKGKTCLYKGMVLQPSLLGAHQRENACLAAEAALQLQKHFPNITEKSIQQGIASAVHRGRLEYLAPRLIFDGAHNPNGCAALAKSLKDHKDIHIILGVMKDKTLAPMLKYFRGRGMSFTEAPNPRALPAQNLQKRAQKLGFCGSALPLEEALLHAPPKGLIVVCGSLYLYAPLVKILKKREDILWRLH